MEKILKDNYFSFDSEKILVKPEQKYKINVSICASNGSLYSAYLCILLLNDQDQEVNRYIKWISDFSGKSKEYTLVFTNHDQAKNIIFGCRVNIETPAVSDMEIEISSLSDFDIQETDRNEPEQFDNIEEFTIPRLPALTQDQEDALEKKMIWVFSSPRSGSTWLGSQLLTNPDNIIWFEPWIGFHLGVLEQDQFPVGEEVKLGNVFDIRSKSSSYFFSPQHKNNWIPSLRKFILDRAYSQAQIFTKNIIIKEPAGSLGSDIIMESLPNSKLIFLLRDGRDVVESSLDMHGKHTWANLSEITSPVRRMQHITFYSHLWSFMNDKIKKAYDNHDPNLRIIVTYEDLKKDTFSELRKIYDFLGVQITDEDLQKKIATHDFNNIPISQKGPGKFYRAGSTGGWKHTFNKEEQDLMNSIMKNTLTRFGYII